jgi:signal transduction histidine kinase
VGYDVTERKKAEEALQRSKTELEERNESLHVINMISQKLHRSLDLQTIADEAVRSLAQHSRSPKVAFLLVNHEKDELELVSHLGFSKETLKAGSRLPLIGSLSGITLSEKRVLTSDDIKHDDRLELTVRDALLDESLQSAVSVPLLFQDEVLGVVNLVLAEHERIDDQGSDTLLSIGKTIGLAIVNARHVARINSEVEVRTRAEEALGRSGSQLRALASRLQEVEEVERKALARELHDRVGQNLTGLNINLNIVRRQLSGESLKHVAARMDDSMNLVEETTARIRDVMAELRPEVLDDYGLIPALEWYVERFAERTGLAVVVQGRELAVRMPEAVESALFRIAQEALTNVAKHAEAKKVTLSFEEAEGLFRLTISDDGKGFEMTALKSSGTSKGWGVLTMQERAQALDGQVRVDTAPGKGTRVVIEVKS